MQAYIQKIQQGQSLNHDEITIVMELIMSGHGSVDEVRDFLVALNTKGPTVEEITAAALIMIVVFGSFVLGNERLIKMFGLGLATAVFVDAFLVRVAVVPAVMFLLGRSNWWLTRRLDRLLPRVSLEAATR